MSETTALLIGVALLIANGFFVGAEFAIMSARRSQLEPLAEEGKPGAKLALYAVKNVSDMLACAQFGVTVCSVSLGAIAEPAIAHLIEPLLAKTPLPEGALHPIAFTIALLIASYFHVVFGEMIPKNWSIAVPVRAVLILGPALVIVARIIKPITATMNAIANVFLRLMNVTPKDEVEAAFTAEQVRAIVAESEREGLLSDSQDLLKGTIAFSERTASEVMVPLDKVLTITFSTTVAEVEALVSRSGYSRLVIENDAHDLAGYLHIKDVLQAATADPADFDKPINAGKTRPLVSVYSDDNVDSALKRMQRAGAHLAGVSDEHGKRVGVLFLEDIVEQIVGTVTDAEQAGRLGRQSRMLGN
ncbi:HlyC/CorC family transporter [Micrococcales bacterium 31B]|nr:HlyC/CorC family transporter [Micrococcales bacterium 31B]